MLVLPAAPLWGLQVCPCRRLDVVYAQAPDTATTPSDIGQLIPAIHGPHRQSREHRCPTTVDIANGAPAGQGWTSSASTTPLIPINPDKPRERDGPPTSRNQRTKPAVVAEKPCSGAIFWKLGEKRNGPWI